MELNGGATIPIIQNWSSKHPNDLLPDEQRWEHLDRRSTHVKIAEAITIPPTSQVTVLVSTARTGVINIEQDPFMLTKIGCPAAIGVILCEPNRAFHVLVVNFSTTPRVLPKGRSTYSATPHPMAITESALTIGAVLGMEKTTLPLQHLKKRNNAWSALNPPCIDVARTRQRT